MQLLNRKELIINFAKNVDWVEVPLKEEGNETMDFAISIEFAKHIAMMAKTKKSHVLSTRRLLHHQFVNACFSIIFARYFA